MLKVSGQMNQFPWSVLGTCGHHSAGDTNAWPVHTFSITWWLHLYQNNMQAWKVYGRRPKRNGREGVRESGGNNKVSTRAGTQRASRGLYGHWRQPLNWPDSA